MLWLHTSRGHTTQILYTVLHHGDGSNSRKFSSLEFSSVSLSIYNLLIFHYWSTVKPNLYQAAMIPEDLCSISKPSAMASLIVHVSGLCGHLLFSFLDVIVSKVLMELQYLESNVHS